VGLDLPPRPEGMDFRWLMSSDVCKHCTEAACLDVCPTGAIFRTEFGTVVIQDDVCNGCGYCITARPFGVIGRRRTTSSCRSFAAASASNPLAVTSTVFAARSWGRAADSGRRPSERQKQAERQLLVVARCPHRHSHRLAADADLERLLDRDHVALACAAGQARHLGGRGRVRRCAHGQPERRTAAASSSRLAVPSARPRR
jgi:Fe-S-cluster-containing dehydrogenase component